MTPAAFLIRKADYHADLAMLRDIRERVFVQEQNVPIEIEWDDLDKDCDHVLAIDAQGQAIGTGRLTPQHTIGRMAVLASWRGKGVGDALLLHLIALARLKQLPSVSLHAQISAIGFYQKHGFSAYGPRYLEAGIVHQSMTLTLS
jgi:predicted GNAT family N-acyltransferase